MNICDRRSSLSELCQVYQTPTYVFGEDLAEIDNLWTSNERESLEHRHRRARRVYDAAFYGPKTCERSGNGSSHKRLKWTRYLDHDARRHGRLISQRSGESKLLFTYGRSVYRVSFYILSDQLSFLSGVLPLVVKSTINV